MTPGVPLNLIMTAAGTPEVTPGPPQDPSYSCSTWDFFFNSSAWQACQNAKGAAMQQAVADRAAYYYGPTSAPAQVAQAAADAQAAQIPADTANIADYYSAGTLIASTPSGAQGSGMPIWVMAALLVGGLMLLRNMNS